MNYAITIAIVVIFVGALVYMKLHHRKKGTTGGNPDGTPGGGGGGGPSKS